MKISIVKVSLLIIPAFLLILSGVPDAGCVELTIYNWEDYLCEEVSRNFTEKTGIKIQQIYFDSDQTRNETVASAQGGRFDIITFDNVATQIFGKNNNLLGLSRSTLPNLEHIDQRWRESCGNFGLPYFYGTVGIVYDKTRYPQPPDSWADLLKPDASHSGHVAMVEDMTDVLIPALLFLGYNINTEKESELKQAYELLLEQIPHVLNYKYALTNIKAPNKEAMHIALAYSGDQYALNDASGTENWQFTIPREGTVIWMDCMTVHAESGHKKEALEFLNYLADPEVTAQNTEEIYAATPISKARAFLSEEAAADTELFPPESLFQNAQMYRILSDKNITMRRRILDALIKKHETQ